MRVGLLVLGIAACSLGMDRAPTRVVPGQRVDCTDGYAIPLIDVTTAVAATAATIYLSVHDPDCRNDFGCGLGAGYDRLGAIFTGAVAVLYGLAAYEGTTIARDCRNAKARSTSPQQTAP